MHVALQPSTPSEVAECVRTHPRVLAKGAGTKARLARDGEDVCTLSTLALNGIAEYEPAEFTVTVLAGTPIRDLDASLAERGQYMPFDPILVKAGATVGGTVAAGTSGPGRFRFGGIRDFILGVRFVDGLGRLLRMGGKVVKNAAGFDLPKFLVGSLGRFGVLTEVTLKVFPRPASTLTLRLPVETTEMAVQIVTEVGQSRWEVDALDIPPEGKWVCLRVAGPAAALTGLAKQIFARWPGECLQPTEADAFWDELKEMRWHYSDGVLVKVPLTLAQVAGLMSLVNCVPDARVQISAGGNVAWASLASAESIAKFDAGLRTQRLSGLTLIGSAPLWLGARQSGEIAEAVKKALDPVGRFPSLEE